MSRKSPSAPRTIEQLLREREQRLPYGKWQNDAKRTFHGSVARRVFFKELGDSLLDSRAILFRLCDHRLAILVHQGNDPTLPYQALVIRKSAMLFPRV